jgi:DNA-binding transcriptional ArsR family regulator
MAKALIKAIRQDRDLWGTTYTAAIELAAMVDDDTEIAETDYEKLARKMRRSVRTAQRHIKKLVEAGKVQILPNLLMRTLENGKVLYRKAKNRYVFLIPWRRNPAQKGMYDRPSFFGPMRDKMAKFLPRKRSEKLFSSRRKTAIALGEEIKNLEKGLRMLTPGSIAYEASAEKLAHLKNLMAQSTGQEEVLC